MNRAAVLFCLAASSISVSAQVTVPNTFTAGAPAKAAEVNANFQALASAINTLTARVAKLDGQAVAADLVGTYAVNGIQTGLTPGTGGGHVSAVTYQGTITLAANGTGTNAAQSTGSDLLLNIPLTTLTATTTAINNGPDTPSFTWSLSNNTVTALGANFTVVAGGRMLVRSTSNQANGGSVLLLLTRVN